MKKHDDFVKHNAQEDLYSILKAFDEIRSEDISLFARVYFPIAIIEVEFDEEDFEEFKEVQKTLLKLISLHLSDPQTISESTGLSLSYVKGQLNLLKGLEYVSPENNLTKAGREALDKDQIIRRVHHSRKFQANGNNGTFLKEADLVDPADLHEISDSEDEDTENMLRFISSVPKSTLISTLQEDARSYIDTSALTSTHIYNISVKGLVGFRYADAYVMQEGGRTHYFYRHSESKGKHNYVYREFTSSDDTVNGEIHSLLSAKLFCQSSMFTQRGDNPCKFVVEDIMSAYSFRGNGLRCDYDKNRQTVQICADRYAFTSCQDKYFVSMMRQIHECGEFVMVRYDTLTRNGYPVHLYTEDDLVKKAASMISEQVKNVDRKKIDKFLKSIPLKDLPENESVLPHLIDALENWDQNQAFPATLPTPEEDPVEAETSAPAETPVDYKAIPTVSVTNIISTANETLIPAESSDEKEIRESTMSEKITKKIAEAAEKKIFEKKNEGITNDVTRDVSDVDEIELEPEQIDLYILNSKNAFSFIKEQNSYLYSLLMSASRNAKLDFKVAAEYVARGAFVVFLNQIIEENNIHVEHTDNKEPTTNDKINELLNHRDSIGPDRMAPARSLEYTNKYGYTYSLKKGTKKGTKGNGEGTYYHFLRILGNECAHSADPDQIQAGYKKEKDYSPLLNYETVILALRVMHCILLRYYGISAEEYPFDPELLPIENYIVYDYVSPPADGTRSACITEYHAYRITKLGKKEYAIMRLYDRNTTDQNFIERNDNVNLFASEQSEAIGNTGMVSLSTLGNTSPDVSIPQKNGSLKGESNFYILIYKFASRPKSLADLLTDSELPDTRDRIKFCTRITKYFYNLHTLKHPIYHRMLNYDCITARKINGEWIPYVIKFDYAKLSDISSTYTLFAEAGAAREKIENKGIEKYLAPEWKKVAPDAIPDWAKVDVYALGMLFLDILTGKIQTDVDPHTNYSGVKNMLCKAELPDLLVDIICEMLEERPSDRPSMKIVKSVFGSLTV